MSEDKAFDYRAVSARLDEIVAAMQSPDITVDEAIARYKEGATLVAEIEKYLQEAEHTIRKVTE